MDLYVGLNQLVDISMSQLAMFHYGSITLDKFDEGIFARTSIASIMEYSQQFDDMGLDTEASFYIDTLIKNDVQDMYLRIGSKILPIINFTFPVIDVYQNISSELSIKWIEAMNILTINGVLNKTNYGYSIGSQNVMFTVYTIDSYITCSMLTGSTYSLGTCIQSIFEYNIYKNENNLCAYPNAVIITNINNIYGNTNGSKCQPDIIQLFANLESINATNYEEYIVNQKIFQTKSLKILDSYVQNKVMIDGIFIQKFINCNNYYQIFWHVIIILFILTILIIIMYLKDKNIIYKLYSTDINILIANLTNNMDVSDKLTKKINIDIKMNKNNTCIFLTSNNEQICIHKNIDEEIPFITN